MTKDVCMILSSTIKNPDGAFMHWVGIKVEDYFPKSADLLNYKSEDFLFLMSFLPRTNTRQDTKADF